MREDAMNIPLIIRLIEEKGYKYTLGYKKRNAQTKAAGISNISYLDMN